jgi:hypothetical protein
VKNRSVAVYVLHAFQKKSNKGNRDVAGGNGFDAWGRPNKASVDS